MKRRNDQKNIKWWSFIFLALFCIGCSELIACYLFSPPTFRKITEPVKSFVGAVYAQGKLATSKIGDLYESITMRREDDSNAENAQIAGDPMYENTSPILDPTITELVYENGAATLTGGVLPVTYYNQSDEVWAEQPYGKDNIGHYGCGPTAMAMAVQSMTGESVDPIQMAEAAVNGGHWAQNQGSYLSIVEGLAADYGLKADALSAKTEEGIRDALFSGKLLVALMGPGHFTSGGHFILIRGVTLQGTLLVADPNSTERSLQEWEPQLILDELSHSTQHGAPIWVLELVEN